MAQVENSKMNQQPKQRVQIPLLKPYIERKASIVKKQEEEIIESEASCFQLATALKNNSNKKQNSHNKMFSVMLESDNNDVELIPSILRLNTTNDLVEESVLTENQQIATNKTLVGLKRTMEGCTMKSRPHFNVESQLRRQNKNKAVKKTVGRWSTEERKRFLQAVELFSDDWTLVEAFVGTRNSTQIRNYALKEFDTLKFAVQEKQTSHSDDLATNQNSNSASMLSLENEDHSCFNQQLMGQKALSLDEQIQALIDIIRSYENLMIIQQQAASKFQVGVQIQAMKKVLNSLITANSTKKRQMKQMEKGCRGSIADIQERLNTVITQDLYERMGVSSQQELNSKYSNLSDWVERPITDHVADKQMINCESEATQENTYSLFNDKVVLKLRALENSSYLNGHSQAYNSLAATSTSMSQMSEDSHDCVSELGDVMIYSPSYEKMIHKRFKTETPRNLAECL